MKYLFAGVLVAICFVPVAAQVIPLQPDIPQGGRAVAIARHPANNNQFIVASESGGLFKSTDGGASWAHVSGSTTFWFTHVLYYPPNANIVLATAEKDNKVMSGGGIWRSIDGGNTWAKVALSPTVGGCNNIIHAYALSADGNRVWAGTSCGLAFSDDGGVSWTFLPSSLNFNNDKVYAIISPGNNSLKILTDAGVKTSANRGASWRVSNTGLPRNIAKNGHNQIAVSPRNRDHLFWAFNHWRDTHWRRALYMSVNNGDTWTSIFDDSTSNRPPFIRTANALGGNSGQFDMYYGDGGCELKKATFNNLGSPAVAGTWTNLSHDHCDASDIAFSTDGQTPLLLTSDGGVHKTTNAGLNWSLAGAGPKGYNALQVTEVTGQKHGSNNTSDLYFSTQDNNTWASPDEGVTWPRDQCCEGFFLNISRQPLPPADTKFSFVSCGGCANLVSGPLLSGVTDFRNPPNNTNGNPRLLEPGKYVQNTSVPGLAATIFNFTADNGTQWVPKYGFPEEVRELSKLSGSGVGTSIFTAVRAPGATPDGNEMIGIKRITGVLDEGTPVVSNITGFGSLGTFPTMFARYRSFGVDVHDANHIIVADITSNLVKSTRDGGATWEPDSALTKLVTQNGTFKFSSGGLTQVSNISFDPDKPGHILLGTIQAGIFRSCDNGYTWTKVQGSEIVPNVSSFYFTGNYKAIASSYGRGLWRLRLGECRVRIGRRVTDYQVDKPFIYYRDALLPLKDIGDPTVCTKCAFYLVDQGEIRTYSTGRNSNKVTTVVLNAGNIRGVNAQGQTVSLPFRIEKRSTLASAFSRDPKLAALFRNKYQVKGIYLEGDVFKGLILAKKNLTAEDLPKQNASPNLHGELLYADNQRKNVKGIRLYGTGFQKDVPVEVLIDGQPVKPDQKEQYDAKGIFSLSIIHPFTVGSHTILLIQRTANTTLREAYTFHVTTHDEPQKK